MTLSINIADHVRVAQRAGTPIVAMESTVYSTLGLPQPHNVGVYNTCVATVEAAGALGAVTAVINGELTLGLADPTPIFDATAKVAARDLAIATAQRWPIGVTTVGASLTIAHLGDLAVFATGGIGGVHRGAATTGDISGDLPVIASLPMVTVCAGAKSFLDLGRTFELLETLGAVVVGWQTDRLPAFTAIDSGIDAPHRVDSAAEVAEILQARRALGQGGVLVCVAPPEPLDPQLLADATAQAEARADQAGVTGPSRTPHVLAGIAEATGGASVSANTALVANNARVAAEIAVACNSLRD